MAYDLGDVASLTLQVRDSTGVLANGGTVVATVTLPDSTLSTPTVTNTSTGNYSASFTSTQVGRHSIRWVVTGANAGAFSDAFDVNAADLRGLISLQDAKDALNIPATSTSNDDELRLFISAATQVIEYLAGNILSQSVSDTFDGGYSTVLLTQQPINSVTSVTENGVTLPASAYSTNLTAGTVSRIIGNTWYAFLPGKQNVTVTYSTGSAIVPASVQLAARELVRHWWQFGQQGQRPAFGTNAIAEFDGLMVAGYAIPNRVVQLLAPHQGIPGMA